MLQPYLDTPIEFLKGVGPRRAVALKKELNIDTFGDLLVHYPFRYIDRTRFTRTDEIISESVYCQLKGKIVHTQLIGIPRAQRFVAVLRDAGGDIDLVWFRGVKYWKDIIKQGQEYIVFGKPSLFNNRFNFAHPEIELASEAAESSMEYLQPFYSSTEKLRSIGLDSKGIRKIIRTLINGIGHNIPETLTPYIISKLKLLSREEAVANIHFPRNNHLMDRAIARLKFEELFYIQLSLLRTKNFRQQFVKGNVFSKVGDHLNEFYRNFLPFELTNAQKRVIREIRTDTASGKQMNRLLQGDVGSGKTLVALMSILIAIDNGFQTCLMAPTEVLAEQHFRTFTMMLGEMPLNVTLLTGNTRKAQRKKLLASLEDGNINILIGTHALIEESVVFQNLGLVIIDEQHRFGVSQRARLWAKSNVPPHVLVMTATPIPRTLAMTLYGDLDVSVIDELPPGRRPIMTFHFTDRDRLKVFGSIRKQISEGRQVYFVYPMIKESETLDLKYLMDGYESLCREFPLPDYAISVVHGQMKSEAKDYEMKRFLKGETQIMVATTVIEVGVDVPNATVMVIENAERFGLSQLHQLRGRVGRGADQSYCILMTGNKVTTEGRQRIATMVNTNDGFEIAEADLHLRGPGDLGGTQQSGILDLKLADVVRDDKILKAARDLAFEILNIDQLLNTDENRLLNLQLRRMEKRSSDFSRIS